jgi:hypothetical protein
MGDKIRTHLKKAFSPDIGVEASSQVLDILEYACGLHPPQRIGSDGKSRCAGILGFALLSNENPNFEMAYRTGPRHYSAKSIPIPPSSDFR